MVHLLIVHIRDEARVRAFWIDWKKRGKEVKIKKIKTRNIFVYTKKL